ncbi:uncharacterized protein LOC133904534 [Phragmites australis]|uniref:uncharacterized protein LOC133904534 n=1 Tax=Phragmites australis TaxID=29695 RepID=UPI002D785189|nr:uncharacterized protein LOC133904534 [Phragmites australis]
MKCNLFLKIVGAVEEKDPWFQQRRNVAGELGLFALQKVTAVFLMLAYESTIIESMRQFVCAVVDVFGDEYLRSPNDEDTARLLATNERRGFPGMLGSIDCSLNDINVLHRSHLLDDLAASEAPKVQYCINGHHYTMGYYLADGIYPEWATFMKPIPSPVGRKRQHFVLQQAAARKDVERTFRVLQSWFPLVQGATRLWDEETLSTIMTTCIIMHNMIIKDERQDDEVKYVYEGAGEDMQPSHDLTPPLVALSQRYDAIRSRQWHQHLRDDLVEHLWQIHGGE